MCFNVCNKLKYFRNSIYNGKISIDEAEMEQTNLLENIVNFSNKSKPRSKRDKDKEQNTYDSTNVPYEGQEFILNAYKSGIFPIKETNGEELKIVTARPMLQKIPIALAQVKAGNTS